MGVVRAAAAVAVAGFAAALLGGCTTHPDPGPVRAPPPRPPRAARAVPPGAPDVPWSRKTHDQRLEYMGLVVFPYMKELFDEHAPEVRLRCQTCHGEDMVARRFAMPAALPPLPATEPEPYARERDEETARFMAEHVVPALRTLLGRGDPATASRVACGTCHPAQR